MRIYLDNCCFNRPFDDQSQTRIRLESEAKLSIQEHIRNGRLELVWSYMVDFENGANPFEERRLTIAGWRRHAVLEIEETAPILHKANLLVGQGLKPKDDLHLACAIAGGCAYFLTTDDLIIKRAQGVPQITVTDPTAFVREVNL